MAHLAEDQFTRLMATELIFTEAAGEMVVVFSRATTLGDLTRIIFVEASMVGNGSLPALELDIIPQVAAWAIRCIEETIIVRQVKPLEELAAMATHA